MELLEKFTSMAILGDLECLGLLVTNRRISSVRVAKSMNLYLGTFFSHVSIDRHRLCGLIARILCGLMLLKCCEITDNAYNTRTCMVCFKVRA